MKKFLSVLLVLLLVTGVFAMPSLAAVDPEDYAGVGNVIVEVQADETTMNPPTNFGVAYTNGTPGGPADGRVWVDKSVERSVDEDDNLTGAFDVTLSAMAQEYIMSESERSNLKAQEAADVLIILDFSTSMTWGFGGQKDKTTPTRIQAMTKAVNQVMHDIMVANKENRIMITCFYGGAKTVLPLGSYAVKENGKYVIPDEYFEYSSSTFRNKRNNGTAISIYNMDTDKTVSVSQSTNSSTYSQYGIAYGCSQFVQSMQADKTFDVQRTPFVLFMTDGEANDVNSKWDTVTSQTSSANNNQIAAYTILTAAYQKDQVIAAYNKRNNVTANDRYRELTDIDWFNVGVALNPVEQGKTPTWMQIMMDPNLTETSGDGTGKDIHDIIQTAASNRSKPAYQSTSRYRYTKTGYVTYAKIADDVTKAFSNLGESVARLTGTTFIPITNTTDKIAPADNVFITFTDTLGKGMQVEGGSTLTVNFEGVKYTGKVPDSGTGTVTLKSAADKTLLSDVVLNGTSVVFRINATELPIVKFASRLNPGTAYDFDKDGVDEVYQDDAAGKISVKPVTLSYTVEPIVSEIAKLTKTSPCAYSNAYDASANVNNGSTTATFIPVTTNTYYYSFSQKTETAVAKASGANLTETAENSSAFSWNNKNYVVNLGNNGRLRALAKIEITSDPTEQVPGGPVVFTITATNLTDEDVTADIDIALKGVTIDGESGTTKEWKSQTIKAGEPWVKTVETHLDKDAKTNIKYPQMANINLNETAQATVEVLAEDGYEVTVKTLLNNTEEDIDDITGDKELYLKAADGKLYALTATKGVTGEWTVSVPNGSYTVVNGTGAEAAEYGTLTVEDKDTVKSLNWVTAKVETKLDDANTDVEDITGAETLTLSDGENVIELPRTAEGTYESAPMLFTENKDFSIVNGTTTLSELTVTADGAQKTLPWFTATVNTVLDDAAADIGDITGDTALYLVSGTDTVELVKSATGTYKSNEPILVEGTPVTYAVKNGTDDGAESYGSVSVGTGADNETTLKWVKPVVVTRLDETKTDLADITGETGLYLGAERIPLEKTETGIYTAQYGVPAPQADTDYVVYKDDTTDANYGKVTVVDGGDNTLTLDWYTVSFDENGHGTKPENQIVAKGAYATKDSVSDPEEKYSFVDWYTDNTFETAFDFENTAITETTEVVAKWKLNNIPVTYPEYTEGKLPADKDTTVPNGVTVKVAPNKNGKYDDSYDVQIVIESATDEKGYTIDPCVADDGYIFAGYTVTTPTEGVVLFTANYYEDKLGDPDDPENGGDNIPDIYEKKLTYTIENGTWDADGKDSADIVEYVELKTEGVWDENGTGTPAKAPTATYPDKEYTTAGKWTKGGEEVSALPTSVTGTNPEQYDFTYTTVKTFDLTYTEAYKPNDPKKTDKVTYGATVTVDPTGGDYTGDSGFKMTDEEGDKESYEVPNPEREHYVFNGWEKSTDEDGNVTLTALWLENPTGTVPGYDGPDAKGDPNGPATPTALEVEPGQGVYVVPHPDNEGDTGAYHVQINSDGDYSRITDPSETGKVFVGWEIDDTYNEVFSPEDGDPYTCVVKLTAKYAVDVVGDPDDPYNKGDGIPDCFQKLVTYTVVHGDWSDKSTEPYDVKTQYVTLRDEYGKWSKSGSGYLDIPDVAKAEPDEAYTDDGAWSDGDQTFPPDNEVIGTNSDNFDYIFGTLKTYTVSYTGDAVSYPDDTKTHGVDLTLPQPEREGYTFDGWKIQGTETVLEPGEDYTANADATMIAQWTINTHDISYPATPTEDGGDPVPSEKTDVPYGTTIRFVPNGGIYKGTTEDTVITMPDEDLDVSPDPTRKGYTFDGWTVSKNGDGLVFTAQWVKDKDVEYMEYVDEKPEDGKPDQEPVPEEVTLPYKQYILVNPNGGRYNGTADPTLLKVTKDLTGADKIGSPIAPSGKTFVGWKLEAKGTYRGTDYVYELVAQYADDTNNDGIADVFERKLTYVVENGVWNRQGEHDPIVEWVPLFNKEGKYAADGVGEAKNFPTDMLPLKGYTENDASWSPDKPADLTKITKNTPDTFTYTFPKLVKVSFDEVQEPGPKAPEPTSTTANSTRTITIDPNGGSYDGHNKPFTEPLTDDVELVYPDAPKGKAFLGWEERVDKNGNLTYIAHYADDVVGDPDDPDNKGDGIPDCFQKRVELIIVNGNWNDAESKGDETRVQYVTLYNENGRMDPDGKCEFSLPTGMEPKTGYSANRDEAQGWDPVKTGDPIELEGTEPVSFTFTFYGVTIHFAESNDHKPVPTDKQMDASKTLTIDPNGGTYNGTKKNTVLKPVGGPVDIGEPTPRDGYRFTGWVYSVNEKTGDVTLTANYDHIPGEAKTGDNGHIALWIAMLVVCTGGLGGYTVMGLRRRKHSK